MKILKAKGVRKMPYCLKCGMKVSDEDARFCPNCGTPMPEPVRTKGRGIIWTNILRERLVVFLVVFALCVLATIAGVVAKVSLQEAQEISEGMNEMKNAIRFMSVQVIFGNNLMYALIMFIPVAGPGVGFYVLYNTGRIIAALGKISNIDPLLLYLLLFIFPFTWLEYVAYALAISESLWIIYAMIKRNLRNEMFLMSMTVVICNILLLSGAIIEAAIIGSYQV